MLAIIYDHETFKDIAWKIFYEFQINQSCKIEGFVFDKSGEPEIKGKLVWDEILRIDKEENFVLNRDKVRRSRKILPCSNGAYVAHKIFRYKIVSLETGEKWTIWRVQ